MLNVLNKLRNPKVLGPLRHLISTVGGALAAKGVVTASNWELYTGIGFALLAVGLSLTAKEKA